MTVFNKLGWTSDINVLTKKGKSRAARGVSKGTYWVVVGGVVVCVRVCVRERDRENKSEGGDGSED